MSIPNSNIPQKSSDIWYLLAINHFPKFGPVRLQRIKSYFPSFQVAWETSPLNFEKAGIEAKISAEFFTFKNKIEVKKIIDFLLEEKISVCCREDPDYPKLLTKIHKPPLLLYYRGSLENCSDTNISIVGSRKFSIYGKQVTENLVKELAENNFNIISGLATGIDAIAHTTCLKNDGITFAVLGTGVEKRGIYPAVNKYLADDIIEQGGAIISEFPSGTPPLRHNFPQRNRIIAGMSRGTLIIEAAKKSGALITAKFALEQNREVFAVPGNIYSPVSTGPNKLIQAGAVPVINIDDILEVLDIEKKQAEEQIQKIIKTTQDEKTILKLLSQNPIHIDELTRELNKPVAEISALLTIMEMKGLIINTGAMQYILAVRL